MKLLFALPGFHRYDRGAEVALLAVAEELAASGESVTVLGSGEARPGTSYDFRHVGSISRERFEKFPSLPTLRNETGWEDLTFSMNLLRKVDLKDFDATITCSFPFTHWVLRRHGERGPKHFFVTQNGDWPAFSNEREFSRFSCDGLFCTNPDYLERNKERWNCQLVPNGADLERFAPSTPERAQFGLPEDKKVVLMVSAMIETKRVADAVTALANVEDAFLVVAGDGPLRDEVESLAANLLPGRFKRVSLPADKMPALYNSADVFLHMSLLESFGNVFVEAMATGLPVVGHDTERLRWIVGDHEFLGDTENLDEVAGLVRSAIAAGERPLNPNLQRFSWSTIGATYEKFIRRTLES